MNTLPTKITLALLVAFAAAAHAESAGTTREQVRAELREAVRTGDVIAPGDRGLKLNELYPQRYGKPVVASATTRADVQGELAAARRFGELIPAGEGGRSFSERFPQRYPPFAVAASKTRAEVKAETLAASRNGDVFAAGEGDLTLDARYPERYSERGHHGRFMAAAPATDRSNQ